jgi:hypothetical protein
VEQWDPASARTTPLDGPKASFCGLSLPARDAGHHNRGRLSTHFAISPSIHATALWTSRRGAGKLCARLERPFSGSDEGVCVVLGKSGDVTRVNACDFTDVRRLRIRGSPALGPPVSFYPRGNHVRPVGGAAGLHGYAVCSKAPWLRGTAVDGASVLPTAKVRRFRLNLIAAAQSTFPALFLPRAREGTSAYQSDCTIVPPCRVCTSHWPRMSSMAAKSRQEFCACSQ